MTGPDSPSGDDDPREAEAEPGDEDNGGSDPGPQKPYKDGSDFGSGFGAAVSGNPSPPHPRSISGSFCVYEVESIDDGAVYYGEPLGDTEEVLREVAPSFRESGYRVSLTRSGVEHVLVAKERQTSVDGVPWKNLALLFATLLTTTFAGARWYGVNFFEDPTSAISAWPFTLSVMGVLAVHELGHYLLARYHDVETSLPYFIPVPNVIGTFGALISMRDNIPSRRALFDIGVAGPLAGLLATVVVTAVGVTLPPVESPSSPVVESIELGYPPLIHAIAFVMGSTLQYGDGLMVNPVVVGGWVGAFITFLNLMPVGQLDGAHVTRAVVGEKISVVQRVVPALLFALAGYLFLFADGNSAPLWAFWGILTLVLSFVGSVTPIDESPVGGKRRAVAALTLGLGILCFTPVPISIVSG